jgi:serine/threonine-protein kinase HipA
MVRELNVWFFGECAGVLTQDKGYLSFQYLPHWLESKNAQPLSNPALACRVI